jgi:hypothetical protein
MSARKHDTHKNESSETMTEFHLKVTSDTPFINPKGTLRNGFVTYRDPTITVSPDGMTVTFVWTGLTIPPGDTFQWIVRCRQAEKNEILVEDAHLASGQDRPDLALPVLGFRVDGNGDYWLTNQTSSSIWYRYIHYTVQPDTFPLTEDEMLDMMHNNPYENPFWDFGDDWTLLYDGVVEAGYENLLATLDIAYGNYFYCYLETDYGEAAILPCSDLQMHEHAFDTTPAKVTNWSRIKNMFR